MKTIFYLFISLGLIIGFNACGESADVNGNTENQTERTDSPEEAERRALTDSEWAVNQVIDIWVNNLDERLTLSDEVRNGIRETYVQAYLQGGGSLDDKIDRDQARELRQRIVKETEDEVLQFLTEDQHQFYTRYLSGDR